MNQSFHYSVFGLSVQSDLPLPQLLATAAVETPDVSIRLAAIPESAERSSGTYAGQDGVLLVVEGVASFRIRAGREILVQAAQDSSDQNVRLYLLGSAMGMLLHQRALLPLHANCVEIDGGAFAFMGRPGAGKSTLAGWFHDRGFRLLADDVSVVGFDEGEGRALVYPGIPRLRLWREALEASGRSSADHSLSYEGDETYEKYDVPVAPEGTATEPRPLVAIYVLGSAREASIVPLQGLGAAEAIFANTYRGAYLATAGDPREHWSACLRLVRTIPVFLVERHLGFEHLDEQSSLMLAHARGLGTHESAAMAANP